MKGQSHRFCGLVVALVAGGFCVSSLAQEKGAEKPKGNPAGTWKWSFTNQQGQRFDSTLKLKLDGEKLSGTYVGRDGKEAPIEEPKFKDGEVSFQVTRERDGQKFSIRYRGKVEGDSIKGQVQLGEGGDARKFDWVATRAVEKPGIAGTWKWSFTTQQGQTFESTVKLKLEGDRLTGAYVGRSGQETAIEDGNFKDGEVSFRVTRERDGQKFTSQYRGKLAGDTIKGQSESNFGGQARTRDWEAKRVEEKK
jgi:hypothetical protein